MLSLLAGVCFVLSSICLTTQIYLVLRGHAVPPFISSTTEHLARKKLLTVLIAAVSFELLLFWYCYTIALVALPALVVNVATGFLEYATLFSLLAPLFVPVSYMFFRDRLLKYWLSGLACPKCREKTPLVDYWQCVGRCKPTLRHVLSPCATCGTKSIAVPCKHCLHLVAFTDPYNEFEVINRPNKYVTLYNPQFWLALLVFVLFTLLLFLSWSGGLTALTYFLSFIVVAAMVTVLLSKPKKLVKNPYYREEPQQWRRSATA